MTMPIEVEAAREKVLEQFKRENISHSTFKNYKSFIEKYLKWCDRNNFDPLSETILRTYYCKEYVGREVHEANRRGFVYAISKFFKAAGKDLKIDRDQLERLCEFAAKKIDLESAEPEEVAKAIRQVIEEKQKPVTMQEKELEEKKEVVVEGVPAVIETKKPSTRKGRETVTPEGAIEIEIIKVRVEDPELLKDLLSKLI